MKIIYRPFAILALGICLAANLAMIAGFAAIEIDLAQRPALDIRNLALVAFGLALGLSIWMLVDLIRHFPEIVRDILG